jgi:hypothetical protein
VCRPHAAQGHARLVLPLLQLLLQVNLIFLHLVVILLHVPRLPQPCLEARQQDASDLVAAIGGVGGAVRLQLQEPIRVSLRVNKIRPRVRKMRPRVRIEGGKTVFELRFPGMPRSNPIEVVLGGIRMPRSLDFKQFPYMLSNFLRV